MNIKELRKTPCRNGGVEFKLDSKSIATRERLSGKQLKKEVEKDIQIITQHLLAKPTQ